MAVPVLTYNKVYTVLKGLGVFPPEPIKEYTMADGEPVILMPFNMKNVSKLTIALEEMGTIYAFSHINSWHHIQWPMSGWPCGNSPWEVCVYDDRKDSAHDNCIYCGNPEERK